MLFERRSNSAFPKTGCFRTTQCGLCNDPPLDQTECWLGSPLRALAVGGNDCLLCLSSTVLAHDIHSNLRDRDGHLCCGGQDCRPVGATVLPNGSYYLPATDEVIPADMATPSPDDRFHHCTYDPVANAFEPWGPIWESKRKTRCFFAPVNSS